MQGFGIQIINNTLPPPRVKADWKNSRTGKTKMAADYNFLNVEERFYSPQKKQQVVLMKVRPRVHV